MSEYLDKLRTLSFGPKKPREMPYTVQLPKHYPYAKRFAPDGTVIWGSKQEARDIKKRAQDNGEALEFDG